MTVDLRTGDSLEILKTLGADSIDSVVTDPPYGLSFMGKKWDYDVPTTELWKEVIRVLKPGGHLLSFSSARTYHRMAVAVEDAGFEIRDQIMWVYGSGFPKSHNIGKKLDTHEGWGTALKPAHEPIVLARKPFKGTVADNVIKHGTGGINIDKSRVESNEVIKGGGSKQNPNLNKDGAINSVQNSKTTKTEDHTEGRFPANFIHDGSDEVLEVFPDALGGGKRRKDLVSKRKNNNAYRLMEENNYEHTYDDKGSAARFFYCAKVSKAERNAGCEEFEEKNGAVCYNTQERCNKCDKARMHGMEQYRCDCENPDFEVKQLDMKKNNHPTVKPVKLMSYLVNLITPIGGTVLDPFMGSGSTGMACKSNNFNFIGIDLDETYVKIAKARIDGWE